MAIPNSFVVPCSKSKLFCPQHWAQEAKDCTSEPCSIVCIIADKQVTLMWTQKMHIKQSPWIPRPVWQSCYSTCIYF